MRWRTASRSTRPSPSGSSIRYSIDRLVRAGGLEPPRAFGPTDFRTSYDLRRRLGALAPRRLWSGLSLHPGVAALGAARLVSTPSRRRAWLGIAVTGFPEFGQFYIGGFPRALKHRQVRCVYRFRHARITASLVSRGITPAKSARLPAFRPTGINREVTTVAAG